MPRYKFAFPIYNAVFAEKELSFQIGDVSFTKKSDLSQELFFINEDKLHLSETHIFAVVVVDENEFKAKKMAYDKCCFATDIFKICTDLYHSNFFNPKKWQFDIDNDFVTKGKSYFFFKELDSSNEDIRHASFHADRYTTSIDSKILESASKWNIKDFESLYSKVYSSNAKSIHNVLKRACHIYSQSFSINNLHERVVLLCTILDTLATNERAGKLPQLQKYLPVLVLKYDKLIENLKRFIEHIYNIRSAYIHNAEKKEVSEDDVDKLEKIVYRVILQMVRNSNKYKSTKEICVAIDKDAFEPNTDNLPDIYIKHIVTTKPCPHNNIDCPCTKEGCPRHGKCCECVAHHKEHGKKLPACLRGIEWEM